MFDRNSLPLQEDVQEKASKPVSLSLALSASAYEGVSGPVMLPQCTVDVKHLYPSLVMRVCGKTSFSPTGIQALTTISPASLAVIMS